MRCFSRRTVLFFCIFLTATPDLAAQSAREWLELGGRQLNSGQFESAILSFRKAADLDTTRRGLAYFQTGLACEDAERFVEAIDAYKSALSYNYSPRAVKKRLLSALTSAGRIQERDSVLYVIAQDYPDDRELQNMIIQSQIARGEYETAEAALKNRLEYFPDDQAAQATLVDLKLKTGKLDELILLARKYTPALIEVLGYKLAQIGRFDLSKQVFAFLPKGRSLSQPTLAGLAKAYCEYRKVVSVGEVLPPYVHDPSAGLQSACFQLASVYLTMEDSRPGEELLRQLIKFNVKDFRSRILLLEHLSKKGRWREAFESHKNISSTAYAQDPPDYNLIMAIFSVRSGDQSSSKYWAKAASEGYVIEMNQGRASAPSYFKNAVSRILLGDMANAGGDIERFLVRANAKEKAWAVGYLDDLIGDFVYGPDVKYLKDKYFTATDHDTPRRADVLTPVTVRDTTAPVILIITPALQRGLKVVETDSYQSTVGGFVSDEQGVSLVYIGGTVASLSEPLLSERTDAKLEGRILKFSGEAMLTPGENMIEVRAIDVNGNMSRTIIRLNRSTTSAQTKSDRKSADSVRLPNIWAVIVGISRYNSPRLQLEYADKDAQSFYGFLKDSIGGAVADERIDLLTNRNATRAEIIRSINEKLRMAFEDDEVILFLACHGIPDEVSDELYFLGYDSDPDNIAGTGISQLDIQKAIASARAKKILLIVDACHSGAFGLAANMTQRGVTASLTNRLLQNLSDARPGVAIFTASSASEFSVEGKLWGGHGVFTNFLVNGLLGPADSDEDGVITIREAYEYVYRHVADATKGKQHPDLQGKFDNNLPVSVIR